MPFFLLVGNDCFHPDRLQRKARVEICGFFFGGEIWKSGPCLGYFVILVGIEVDAKMYGLYLKDFPSTLHWLDFAES